MASNYPPGVTGNEYHIAGPDYEKESDIPCPTCGKPTMEEGYADRRWLACLEVADHITDLEPLEDDLDIESDWGHTGEELEGEPR